MAIVKKRTTFFRPILIFVLAQLAWLSLVGLWIYWYVSNYITLKQVGQKLPPQIAVKGPSVITLIWGLILLVIVLLGMYFIFIYLTRQTSITRLYDSFIASVTHELKSPLASIQLYLETLMYRRVPPEKQREFLASMMQDSRRLEGLINSILDISAIEQRKMAFHYRLYRAETVVTELVAEAREQFKLGDNIIRLAGRGECSCVIDRASFKIVINNLIDNAVKYSPAPPRIQVQMLCLEKVFQLSISDNGIGIPESERKKIFHKFYRISGAVSPNIKGTGLGLYMVQEIVHAHGGKISVAEGPGGKGSTFTIELPIYPLARKRYLKRLLGE